MVSTVRLARRYCYQNGQNTEGESAYLTQYGVSRATSTFGLARLRLPPLPSWQNKSFASLLGIEEDQLFLPVNLGQNATSGRE